MLYLSPVSGRVINLSSARVEYVEKNYLKYRSVILGIVLSTAVTCAQSPQPPDSISIDAEDLIEPMQVPQVSSAPASSQPDLPDAPSATQQQYDVVVVAQASFKKNGTGIPPCSAVRSLRMVTVDPNQPGAHPNPCSELVYPYEHFLDDKFVVPLTWQEKGYLALHQWSDPSNLMTIAGISAINIAADSHTAYGPGFQGWATLTGVSLSQDATGQFFGNFLIPSLAHQDPRYFRMGKGSIPRRIGNAVSQTYWGNRDGGGRMPNYGVLLAYPIASVISNLYVPGIEGDARSTTKRVFIGYALEPVNNLVSEFLPDLARHIHVRVIFVQNILNNIAAPGAAP